MREDRTLSNHPTDRLIRELIQTGRLADRAEIERILDRVATAPFDPRVVSAAARERGLTYEGRTVQRQDEALFIHVVRRIVLNRQWAYGTTQEEYVDDLHRSARAPSAKLALYQRRGGYVAATLTRTSLVIAPRRRGPRTAGQIWVVYSADRGIILTGYQVSSSDEVSIPEETRWLL